MRSQLYVPANDEKKLRRAASLDCDSIIFDLEDAVPAEEKSSARNTLRKMLEEEIWKDKELGIRINKVNQKYSSEDISIFKNVGSITFLVLPKSENPLGAFENECGKKLMPLIETARGLLRIEDIAESKGVFALGYGAADFADSVQGLTSAYLENPYVKTKIVATAASCGLMALDNVFFDLSDLEGFRKQAQQSRGLGYSGKQVIHPSQIPIANEIYSPSEQEIESARKIVSAYEAASRERRGAFKMNDQLIDAVHYRQAKKTLGEVSE
ncbi:MAG TPA: CoA ester lyase [Nitrososphaerales archaeon]|nr:CoA ester lyase [Nitrososphaerales archaeon]